LTCHDPHKALSPRESIAHTRAICLKCHQPERCTVTPSRRQQENPENNCVQCHMPSSPTEIPHLAFTHHRIGIHKTPAEAKTGGRREGPGVGVLEPFLDLSRLSAVDQKRSLGLGYLEVASLAREESVRVRYQQRAMALLAEVHKMGLRDPALDAGLSRVRFALGHEDFLPYAESALAHADLTGQDRSDALFLVADAEAARRRYAEAVAVLGQLNGLRRHAIQNLLLADCERALGHHAAAETALQNAVRIDPRLWKVHQELAERYRRQGDLKRAAWHQVRAVP
jgi:predicted CXXCH cytochrome family protein